MSVRIRRLSHNTFEGLTTLLNQILQQYSTIEDSNGAANYRASFAFPSSHECVLEQIFTSVGSAVMTTGSGLDDATSGGTYSGTEDAKFEVRIADGAPLTDTMDWRKDGGSWSTPTDIVAGAMALSDGVTITFAATDGHTTNDVWTIYTMIS